MSLPGPFGGRRGEPLATEPVAEPESAARDTPRRGEMLGRYFILHELGRGGMGVVYRAYDPELDRKVALKLLHPDRAKGRDGGVGQARLLREAQALAKLSHPNVIHVYDAGTVGDRVFMAMELVEGETLDAWLEREPRPWRTALALFRAAGQGLAAAHAAGLVHRDFKPGNVLLGADGRVRVVDFGIARPAAEGDGAGGPLPTRGGLRGVLSTPLTRVGVVLGTPRYMAPEVIRGGAFDHRADQFSFCVALFESLYRTAPFAGDDLPELVEEVEAGRVREVPRSRVPAWVRRILLRGLSADPARRYPAMEDLLADLGRDRGALLRRRAAAAAVVAAVTAGGIALYTVQRGEARLCSGAGERLAGIWDAGRKDAIRRAFLASGRPYAADAWTGVEKALDAYTGAWTAQRTEACEATHRRGEQSPELLDLRMGCLDRRLREVRALTHLFASGDPAVVEKAAQASRGLSSLAGCADRAALTAPVRPPAGEAARRTLERLNTRMAEAKSLWSLGRYQEALAISSPAVGAAARLGYPPLEAELLRERARAEESLGEAATAEATLYQALAAAQKGRHDTLAAGIWTDLVWSTGYRQRRFDEARRWARLAEASIARLGGPAENPELDADLKGNLGAVLDLQGDHAGGLDLLRQAQAGYEKTLGPDHPNVSRTLNRIGGVYYQTERHAEALATYQRALEHTRRTLGPRHPTVAIRLGNIALALEGLGRYEEALRTQRQALAIEEAALGPDHPRLSATHGNLAALLLVLRRHDEALDHARRGLAIDLKNPETDPADLGASYLTVSDALYRLERYGEALEPNRRARKLLTKSVGASHPWTAAAEDTYGRILLAQGRPAEAVAPLRRAVAAYEANGGGGPDRIGARFALARALWDSGGDRAEALKLARDAKAAFLRDAPWRKDDVETVEEWLRERT